MQRMVGGMDMADLEKRDSRDFMRGRDGRMNVYARYVPFMGRHAAFNEYRVLFTDAVKQYLQFLRPRGQCNNVEQE